MRCIEGNINSSQSASKESSYDSALCNYNYVSEKREFFDRISKKYWAHIKLLTDSKNFRYMYDEIDRIKNNYDTMLDSVDSNDFDYVTFEKNFDKMIEDDTASMITRSKSSL
ncbi:MAG: hypothetical protein EHM58_02575 [Ignavibacteriae bacterium]|nr:MAG: hypothetical protein EHM58_02575 [Ignavibacteriota bacterium]